MEYITNFTIKDIIKQEKKMQLLDFNGSDLANKVFTASQDINQSYLFLPKFQNKKNKKEIVDHESLLRQLDRVEQLNFDLKKELSYVKK